MYTHKKKIVASVTGRFSVQRTMSSKNIDKRSNNEGRSWEEENASSVCIYAMRFSLDCTLIFRAYIYLMRERDACQPLFSYTRTRFFFFSPSWILRPAAPIHTIDYSAGPFLYNDILRKLTGYSAVSIHTKKKSLLKESFSFFFISLVVQETHISF